MVFMVDLEWYRSFVAVYRSGTVSGAAQARFMTQPGVSQHLAALERALSVTLFMRAPRRMIPTKEGAALYTRVADAIERLESVTEGDGALRGEQRLRLGAPSEFFTERILPRITLDERTRYVVRFGVLRDLLMELLSMELDVIVATQRGERANIEYRPLFEERFWLVGPPGSTPPNERETQRGSTFAQWCVNQPWIAYGPELPIIRWFWRQVFGYRLDLAPRLILPDLRAIRTAVENGVGLSVLPDYLCQSWVADGRLALLLEPDRAVTNDLWLAFRKADQHIPRLHAFSILLEAGQHETGVAP